jgi:hypothetical protein
MARLGGREGRLGVKEVGLGRVGRDEGVGDCKGRLEGKLTGREGGLAGREGGLAGKEGGQGGKREIRRQ